MTVAPRPRSPLALVLLALVAEEPVHPYRMQQLIQHRGQDRVANVARSNSVYQAIDALTRAGLIEVRETSKGDRRPDRTIYQATPLGRRTLKEWMGRLLAEPQQEFPDFPAALALLAMLDPPEVLGHLKARLSTLQAKLSEADVGVAGLPRLFVLEDEYKRLMLETELRWVSSVASEIEKGELTWSPEWLERFKGLSAPPE